MVVSLPVDSIGMSRCGRSVAVGLPKIISAGYGSPVSIGVARKVNSELYVFTVRFWWSCVLSVLCVAHVVR